jgi:hypothetical protein
MMQVVLIGISAGAATALLFASVASGSLLSVPLFYLAPLPILIAAMGWSHWAALIAAVVASAASRRVRRVLLHAFMLGDRAAGVVARLSRAAGAAATHPRPTGSSGIRSAIWCSGPRSSARAIVIAGMLTSARSRQLPRVVAQRFERMLNRAVAVAPDRPRATSEPADRHSGRVLPPAAAVLATITNVVNLWLAERIVKISGGCAAALRSVGHAFRLCAAVRPRGRASFLPGIVGISAGVGSRRAC